MTKNKLKEGNCLYRIFMLYALKLLKKGNEKVFETEDLWELDDDLFYLPILQNFKKYQQTLPAERTLFWKVIGFAKIHLFIFLICDLIGKLLAMSVPYALRALIAELLLSETESTGNEFHIKNALVIN
jgi:hypothetical protein